jgi:hypothetical protein
VYGLKLCVLVKFTKVIERNLIMKDFTEQAVSTTSLPESSVDTPIESDSLQDIDEDTFKKAMEELADMPYRGELADPETTAATLAALAPWLDNAEYVQDETESIPV